MSTIIKKTIPAYKTISRGLYLELLILQNKATEVHTTKDDEKQKTLLKYKRINLLKQNGDVSSLDLKLKDLEEKVKAVDATKLKDETLYGVVVGEETKDLNKLNFLKNVGDFLTAQRVYTELLERYNPGLTLRQDDNVRLSANRVGLQLPE